MKSERIERYRTSFEHRARQYQGIECWSARELQPLLGYEKWQNFVEVIERAVQACQNSRQEPKYHFANVSKLIETGKGAQRQVEDFFFTRFDYNLIR